MDSLTLANLAQIVSIIIGFGGVMWRISASQQKLKDDITKELKEMNTNIVKIEKEVAEISVETKFVREDHDNLVKLASHVDDAKKDINGQYGKIRDIENNVSQFISTFRRKHND